MMRIVYVVCAAFDSGTFTPAVPLACIHAAGPELERRVAEGWTLERWSCAEPDIDLRIAETPAEGAGR